MAVVVRRHNIPCSVDMSSTMEAMITCKRKTVSSSMISYEIHAPPSSLSSSLSSRPYSRCNKMRRVTETPQQNNDEPQPCFASLPRELLYDVVAFIGPTSSSLCALSQVSQYHKSIMSCVGDVMLARARLRFRIPIPPMSICESSISLFVRHARASKVVHDSLQVLENVLKKDFPYICTSSIADEGASATKLSLCSAVDHHVSENNVSDDDSSSLHSRIDGLLNVVAVEPSEVNNALSIALCLLGCPSSIEDLNGRKIYESAATTALEWRVDLLCSVLSAKAYKFAKSRMCRRYEQEDNDMSYVEVTDEMVRFDEDGEDSDSLNDDHEDISLDPSDMDMQILDKSSLVMQHIVLRKQHQRSTRI